MLKESIYFAPFLMNFRDFSKALSAFFSFLKPKTDFKYGIRCFTSSDKVIAKSRNEEIANGRNENTNAKFTRSLFSIEEGADKGSAKAIKIKIMLMLADDGTDSQYLPEANS